MDLITGATAAIAGAGSLFSYNKDAYIFNRTLLQNKVHQRHNMRIQRGAMYREDITNLFNLTIQKMDNYLLVNTLMLGFCVEVFYDGRVPPDTPSWVFWLWLLSLVSAMTFLFLSVWLSLHASITAQAFSVRFLVQWLRLPIPKSDEIEQASATLQDMEKGTFNEILRIPGLERVNSPIYDKEGIKDERNLEHGNERSDSNNEKIQRKMERAISRALVADIDDADAQRDANNLNSPHIQLYLSLQSHWQPYDAYARVCMTIGVNQFIISLGVFSITFFMVSVNTEPWAAVSSNIVFAILAAIHIKMNISPKSFMDNILMNTLLVAPTLFTVACSILQYVEKLSMAINYDLATAILVVAALVYISNASWIFFLGVSARENFYTGLPSRYISVGLCTDILRTNVISLSIEEKARSLGLTEDLLTYSSAYDPPSRRKEKSLESSNSALKSRILDALNIYRNLSIGFDRPNDAVAITAYEKSKHSRLKNRFEEARTTLNLCLARLGVDYLPSGVSSKMDTNGWNKMSFDIDEQQSGSCYVNYSTGVIESSHRPLLDGICDDGNVFKEPYSTLKNIEEDLQTFIGIVDKLKNICESRDARIESSAPHSKNLDGFVLKRNNTIDTSSLGNGALSLGVRRRQTSRLININDRAASMDLDSSKGGSDNSHVLKDDFTNKSENEHTSNMKQQMRYRRTLQSRPWILFRNVCALCVSVWCVAGLWAIFEACGVPTGYSRPRTTLLTPNIQSSALYTPRQLSVEDSSFPYNPLNSVSKKDQGIEGYPSTMSTKLIHYTMTYLPAFTRPISTELLYQTAEGKNPGEIVPSLLFTDGNSLKFVNRDMVRDLTSGVSHTGILNKLKRAENQLDTLSSIQDYPGIKESTGNIRDIAVEFGTYLLRDVGGNMCIEYLPPIENSTTVISSDISSESHSTGSVDSSNGTGDTPTKLNTKIKRPFWVCLRDASSSHIAMSSNRLFVVTNKSVDVFERILEEDSEIVYRDEVSDSKAESFDTYYRRLGFLENDGIDDNRNIRCINNINGNRLLILRSNSVQNYSIVEYSLEIWDTENGSIQTQFSLNPNDLGLSRITCANLLKQEGNKYDFLLAATEALTMRSLIMLIRLQT